MLRETATVVWPPGLKKPQGEPGSCAHATKVLSGLCGFWGSEGQGRALESVELSIEKTHGRTDCLARW